MIYGCIGKYITNKMANYLFCASNESIPGILLISCVHIDVDGCKFFQKFELEGSSTLCLDMPYNYIFVKKTTSSDVGLFKRLFNERSFVRLNKTSVANFYRNSIAEVKAVFDDVYGDYIDYKFEDILQIQSFKNKEVNENKVELERLDIINNEKTKRETEDRIINSYFKTLEDTLEKKKGELERLDAILSERKAEIAKLNK
jgi:vacuolar-type H+-ATPase subunit I/STV1